MPRNHPEQDLQKTVAAFLDVSLPEDAVYTAINPVPGKSRAAAGLSKAMGMKAGILDILIVWRCGIYFIELKAKGGKTSKEQEQMIMRLSNAGAHCAVSNSLDGVVGHLITWGFPLRARLAA